MRRKHKIMHSEDFKNQAVARSFAIGTTAAAREVGVGPNQIYTWKKLGFGASSAKLNGARFVAPLNGNGHSTASADTAALQAKNDALTMEVKRLKGIIANLVISSSPAEL